MIIKGKYDWYSPENALSGEARSVFNQLPSIKELPHIPHYVMQLQELIQKESTTSRQLADVAKKAPILASNILRIANNQCGVSGSQIESLEHAISYVGLNALKDMVLVAALNTFEFKSEHFKSEDFWEASFLCGRIAEFLAKRFSPDTLPDEAYIAGTLANVGKVVQAITNPDLADQISQDISNVKILGSWSQAEERHNAFDHCILGEIGAMFWGLPEYVIDSIAAHHKKPQSMIASHFTVNDLVTFANQLSHWVLLQPTQMNEALLEASYEKFGLSPAQAEVLINEIMPLKSVA
ncbi:HDOD domain-containing protein [Pseudobacteriovorax antillogorgiicola]|nr:HDOD domain-containing protein [Pseudobacteriovorax antillogorgiicola]